MGDYDETRKRVAYPNQNILTIVQTKYITRKNPLVSVSKNSLNQVQPNEYQEKVSKC
jgi:hypothetical protein